MNLDTLVTKYLGATDYKGTRIKAVGIASTGYRKSLTVSWDYALNERENHVAAAKAWHRKHCSEAEQNYSAARSPKDAGVWNFVPEVLGLTYTF